MDFGFNEEQEMLRQSARGLLEKECPAARVRELMEDARGYDPALWKQMAELGWIGLVLPERYGGAGLSWVDLVLLLEEMGRALLPSPFIPTLLFAEAIRRGGSPEQQTTLLRKIASGDMIGTLAYLEPSGVWGPRGIVMPGTREGEEFLLEGEKLYVPDGHIADYLIVAARTGEPSENNEHGITLFAIEARRRGLTISPLVTMDQTRRLSRVQFDSVRVGRDDIVGAENRGWLTLSPVLDRGKFAMAAEMVGGATKVMEMAVEYSKDRVQFGRPIGSFQAVQHKCADMLVQVEGARSATYYAAWALTNEVDEAPLAAAVAKAAASDAYRRTAADGVQVHGGIGFTWEHDMHLYFKRARSSEVAFGDANFNREVVARLIGL